MQSEMFSSKYRQNWLQELVLRSRLQKQTTLALVPNKHARENGVMCFSLEHKTNSRNRFRLQSRSVITLLLKTTLHGDGKYETVRLLIEHGANIDDQENLSGNVPLCYAIYFIYMRIFELLIENGASIDFKALDGATALTYAVNYREKEMAEILIAPI